MYSCKRISFSSAIEEFVHDRCNKAGIRLKKKIAYPVLLNDHRNEFNLDSKSCAECLSNLFVAFLYV